MKRKVLRVNAEEIEGLYYKDKATPRRFLKTDPKAVNATARNVLAELRVDFVNYILSRINDIRLPYFTGKAVRFELWIDDHETNDAGEPQLSIRFWVPSPFPKLKRGLWDFEYPIN